jgi:exosortase/archaeosortase family protein
MLTFAALVAATWPVCRWMTVRFADGSSDTWELLAALTAAAVIVRDRHPRPEDSSLILPAFLLLIYAASYSFLSPLPRGMLAMAAIGTAISALWYGRRVDVPICGLLLISLPVMASLNFFLGYPLRVVAGSVAEGLLQMNGIAAVREGALLSWNGHRVAIDAPCSGIKMLWTGAYLSFSLAALMRLSGGRTVVLTLLTGIVIVAANALRASSLFYGEAVFAEGPASMHDAIGLVMFAFAAIAVFILARKLAGDRHA